MKPTRFNNEMIEEYFRKGIWPAESSVDVFERNAEDYSSACALKDSRGHEVTWLQLKMLSDRIAVQLTNLGYRHDDTMVVQMPNIVENGIVRVALMKAGLIAAYPPMTIREKELEGILQGMGAKGYIVMEENGATTL